MMQNQAQTPGDDDAENTTENQLLIATQSQFMKKRRYFIYVLYRYNYIISF